MKQGGVAVDIGEPDRSNTRQKRAGLRIWRYGVGLGAADLILPSQVKAEDLPYELSRIILQTSNARGQGHPQDPVARCWIGCLHRMCDLELSIP